VDDVSARFGARIRALRQEQGLSQEQLAERAELSRDAVVRLESGERGPRLETVAALASALGTTLPDLLDFDQGDKPSPHRDSIARLTRLLGGAEPQAAQLVLALAREVVAAFPRRAPASRSRPPADRTALHGTEDEAAPKRVRSARRASPASRK